MRGKGIWFHLFQFVSAFSFWHMQFECSGCPIHARHHWAEPHQSRVTVQYTEFTHVVSVSRRYPDIHHNERHYITHMHIQTQHITLECDPVWTNGMMDAGGSGYCWDESNTWDRPSRGRVTEDRGSIIIKWSFLFSFNLLAPLCLPICVNQYMCRPDSPRGGSLSHRRIIVECYP